MTRTLHGAYRADGTFIGFDYENQHWIDTAYSGGYGPGAAPGSARTPLNTISARDTIIED